MVQDASGCALLCQTITIQFLYLPMLIRKSGLIFHSAIVKKHLNPTFLMSKLWYEKRVNAKRFYQLHCLSALEHFSFHLKMFLFSKKNLNPLVFFIVCFSFFSTSQDGRTSGFFPVRFPL